MPFKQHNPKIPLAREVFVWVRIKLSGREDLHILINQIFQIILVLRIPWVLRNLEIIRKMEKGF